MQVQRGELTLTSTSQLVTLATPVPVGKSFPIISVRSSDSGRLYEAVTVELTNIVDNHYTQIRLQRQQSTYNVIVVWQVITGDMFTVQSGTTMPGYSSTTANVTVNEVDLNSTFVVLTTRVGSETIHLADPYLRVRAELTNTTTLTLTRGNSGRDVRGVWYVVTLEGATVQQINGNLSNASSSNIGINEVDLSKTFLFCSWSSTYSSSALSGAIVASFVDSLTVNIKTYIDITASFTGFVVTHPKINVVSNVTTIGAGASSSDILATVDETAAFSITNSIGGSSSGWGNIPTFGHATHNLSSSYLQLRRLNTSVAGEIAWFVVEWRPVIAPSSLSPDNVAVMPNEQNTFTWSKDASMTATAYEWGYREVGAASWIDSGKIISSEQKVVVAANTFTVGKSYEWRIRHWDDEQVDPSDWVYATFNTSNPVIVNPTPVPDSSIRVDIQNFGSRLKSPYGRDIQLTIEIADNASYTNPTTYTLPSVVSGELSTIEHAIQQGGTWYVRLTATDSESLQTVLEYSFFAGQFIQFITMPTVQLGQQQATHVTVRVRDTTTEYTAVVSPAPTADKIVERLFYIQAGTQATCQAVAEAFLAKMGRPQVRVSGVIPLTVTLRFGQKIRVKIPEAGIDEEMILQRKEHRINESEAATYVVLGDIFVTDDEMIARIVERGI